MEKLKECPFCGESESLKAKLLPTSKGDPWKTIVCIACGAQGPISKDGILANKLWQKRFRDDQPMMTNLYFLN